MNLKAIAIIFINDLEEQYMLSFLFRKLDNQYFLQMKKIN